MYGTAQIVSMQHRMSGAIVCTLASDIYEDKFYRIDFTMFSKIRLLQNALHIFLFLRLVIF